MTRITVDHLGGDRFDVAVRGHHIAVDQPVTDGGDDTGATPTELFVAGLVACVAHYARRYLARHGLPTAGLGVTGEFDIVPRPARVGAIDVRISLPAGVPAERRAALLAVASHCTVHNTLDDVPPVMIDVADRRSSPPSGGTHVLLDHSELQSKHPLQPPSAQNAGQMLRRVDADEDRVHLASKPMQSHQ